MVKYLSKSFIINFLLILIIFFLDRFSKIYLINFYEKNYGSDLYNSKFLNISLGMESAQNEYANKINKGQ